MRKFSQFVSMREAAPEPTPGTPEPAPETPQKQPGKIVPIRPQKTPRSTKVTLRPGPQEDLVSLIQQVPELRNRPNAIEFVFQALKDQDGNKLEQLLRGLNREDLVAKLNQAETTVKQMDLAKTIDELKQAGIIHKESETPAEDIMIILNSWRNVFARKDEGALREMLEYLASQLSFGANFKAIETIADVYSRFLMAKNQPLGEYIKNWLEERGGKADIEPESWDAFAYLLKKLPKEQYNQALDIMIKQDPEFLNQLKRLWQAQGKDLPATEEENEAFLNELRPRLIDALEEYIEKEAQRQPQEAPAGMSRRTFLKLVASGVAGLTGAALAGVAHKVIKDHEQELEQAIAQAEQRGRRIGRTEAGQQTMPIIRGADGKPMIFANFKLEGNPQEGYNAVITILPKQGVPKPKAEDVYPKVSELMKKTGLKVGKVDTQGQYEPRTRLKFVYRISGKLPEGFTFQNLQQVLPEHLTFTDWITIFA